MDTFAIHTDTIIPTMTTPPDQLVSVITGFRRVQFSFLGSFVKDAVGFARLSGIVIEVQT